VTTLLLRGADVLVVQRLAGHASVSTTMRYDRRGDDAMRKAAAVMGDLFDHAA
jgi:site-specific recombinase XerD